MPWDCADVVHVRTPCVKLHNVGSGVMDQRRHYCFNLPWKGRIHLVASRVPVGIVMTYYNPMENNAQWYKKSLREWLLNLCGYEIWPPTHNDPRIQGPQPRIISKRQREAMQKSASAVQ